MLVCDFLSGVHFNNKKIPSVKHKKMTKKEIRNIRVKTEEKKIEAFDHLLFTVLVEIVATRRSQSDLQVVKMRDTYSI